MYPSPFAGWLVSIPVSIVVLSRLVPAVSAYTEYPSSGALHGATSLATMLAVVCVVVGSVWALAEAAYGRAIAPWYAVAIFGLLAALFMKVLVGF